MKVLQISFFFLCAFEFKKKIAVFFIILKNTIAICFAQDVTLEFGGGQGKKSVKLATNM